MNRLSCLCLIAVAFCLSACSTVTGVSADEAFVRGTLDRIERTFAPDKRLIVWETTAVARNGKIVVQGKTDSAKALDALECTLAKQQVSAEVEVSLLPNESPDVGKLSWALVSVPVASVSGRPAFASPMTTQALLGTPLRVLEYQRPFWRVQMPDGYIGWVHALQLRRLTQAELSEWNAARQVVVTARATELKDSAGAFLMPLTVGSRLRLLGQNKGQMRVQLPDGRIGWLAAADVQDARAHAAHWQALRKDNSKAFWLAYIAQAKRLLGTPYLWGGTSSAGVDCSGFVSLLWQMTGFVSQRDADQQIANAQRLNLQAIEQTPVGGYLAFGKVDEAGTPRIEHIAISLGRGDFIHSLGSVRIESVLPDSPVYSAYNRSRFLGAYAVDLKSPKDSALIPLEENGFYAALPRMLYER